MLRRLEFYQPATLIGSLRGIDLFEGIQRNTSTDHGVLFLVQPATDCEFFDFMA